MAEITMSPAELRDLSREAGRALTITEAHLYRLRRLKTALIDDMLTRAAGSRPQPIEIERGKTTLNFPMGERIPLKDVLELLPKLDRHFAPPGTIFIISAGMTGIARVYYPVRSLWQVPFFTHNIHSARLLNHASLAASYGNFWQTYLVGHFARTIHIELIRRPLEVPSFAAAGR
jgi:hypothetical protein